MTTIHTNRLDGGLSAADPSTDLSAIEGLNLTGILVRTGTNSWTLRTIAGPVAGISIADGDGVAGAPTLALVNDLAALEGLAATGIAVRSGDDSWVQRSIAAGTGISVSNGDGVSGNPSVAIDTAVVARLGAENQALSGGAAITPKNLGTQSSGTLTVDAGDCPQQTVTNGGAFTLDMAAVVNDTRLQITNNASAGSITTSAFDDVTGDSFDTTDGNVFHCLLRYAPNGKKFLDVKADPDNG